MTVLFLLQHWLNSRQIWPRLVLLHFCSIGSSLNPASTTWMGDAKRSCTRSCHVHQMSLRSICCHAAYDGYRRVIWKLEELSGGLERPELETDTLGDWSHSSHWYNASSKPGFDLLWPRLVFFVGFFVGFFCRCIQAWHILRQEKARGAGPWYRFRVEAHKTISK